MEVIRMGLGGVGGSGGNKDGVRRWGLWWW